MDSNLKEYLMFRLLGRLFCQDVAEMVTEYLEGALPLSKHIRFRMHLGLCRDCRNYLKQMNVTIQTLHKLPAEPISPHVREELIRRFQHWKNQ